ncbi:MAG: hypothetical protein LUH07_15545, partial [Lachnospiraceae bacterium]|nr:hypothetical protein [Lachnospiraceae bacterium]
LYHTEGMKIGLDKDLNEVRIYSAVFLSSRSVYAVSVLTGSVVTIYFLDDYSLWRNPNIRIWNMVHMEQLLLRTGAFVLHCSYLMYDGSAILFSAPSGTGKTTQAELWKAAYHAAIINGDKAIIRRKGKIWYACGYPFHGSAVECLNLDYPIKAIVVVRQNPDDFMEELRPMRKVQAIYSEATVNAWDTASVNHALSLIEELTETVTVVCQHCTMKDEAYRTLYRYLYEEG